MASRNRSTAPTTAVQTGTLSSGHPFARVGSGETIVLSIPGLSLFAGQQTPKAVTRAWRSWFEAIDRHGLTVIEVGRRPDLPIGSTAQDVADDYAAVIRAEWGRPVGIMGFSTGGGYAQYLAARHPDLVRRAVLAVTGHRIPAPVKALQRAMVDDLLAHRWRSGYAKLGPWLMPNRRRLASAVLWLVGPWVIGRPADQRALAIDAAADDGFDASEALASIRCPTLVISAGRDEAYPPELTREFVAGIAGARHIDYAGAGHGTSGSRLAEDACAFLAGR